ncbi:MAG: hypothetical protein JSU57_06645 [Candidatus Heimdallarchaeota archaeon]|nr:MAG: hypothetical protein JSU57_06645 [Candidatus Heimdallarchaeota archaeon]
MSVKPKHIIFYMIICIIFSLNSVLTVGADSPTEEETIVVLFDEGHGQFFNYSIYSQAISDLIINKSMKVVFNKGEINRTSFEGVDIFISTNPQKSFSEGELHYVNKFLTQGNAIMLLGNPLDEDNITLNGRGDILNDFLYPLEFSFQMGLFWTQKIDDDYKPTDVIHNEFSNVGNNSKYLLLELNSSDHNILSINNNISSIVTSSGSVDLTEETAVVDPVIVAPPEAVAMTTSGEISSGSSDIVLFGASGDLEIDARVLLGGSSIMFSDLIGPFGNSTWYNSEDNSLLWLNIFDWLAEAGPQTSSPSFISEQDLFFVIILIIVIAIFFLLGGSIFFLIGSGREILIIKSGEEMVATPKSTDKTIEPSPVQSSPSSKESRRDRRLKQIKKHHRRR